MSKLIADLQPQFQTKARNAYELMQKDQDLKDMGVEAIAISETKRSLVTQMAYYSRGRMDPEDVKKMYAAAGLYDISTEEAKTPNTWTLKSKHIDGLAIDLVPVKDGKYWWTAPYLVWERMGEIGESVGLSWGGRWKTADCPHFE